MRKIGELGPGELEARQNIRQWQIPPSNTRSPDIYWAYFANKRIVRFKRGVFDPWNSHFEFLSEVNVRERFWYPNIKKGDVVVDAGASWGSYSITAGLLGAQVHAFEPDPRIYPEFLTNIELNRLTDSIKTYNLGLSNQNRKINWEELKDMEVRTLDSVHIDNLDFIKIDVDGQELELLEGARETLIKDKPKILLEAHMSLDHDILNKAAEYIFKSVDGYKLIMFDAKDDGATIYAYFWHAK